MPGTARGKVPSSWRWKGTSDCRSALPKFDVGGDRAEHTHGAEQPSARPKPLHYASALTLARQLPEVLVLRGPNARTRAVALRQSAEDRTGFRRWGRFSPPRAVAGGAGDRGGGQLGSAAADGRRACA